MLKEFEKCTTYQRLSEYEDISLRYIYLHLLIQTGDKINMKPNISPSSIY